MNRAFFNHLEAWRTRPGRLPLLVRGARQVGKTYIIESFAKARFSSLVNVNFELQPEFQSCFTNLQPNVILNQLEGLLGRKIDWQQTLLFLDEIQECPLAIMAMRYFKEQMPELAVIGAGSLLEFALRDENFSMPVGRVEYLYLKPLSFCEYLQACGFDALLEMLRDISLNKPLASVIHDKLLKLVREYLFIGGMPAVVNTFLQTHNYQDCQHMQTVILSTYRNDFGRYASHANHKYLQKVFTQTPGLIGKQIKYTHFDQEMRSRDLKAAIENLTCAGVISPVIATTASQIPLSISSNDRLFKLLFLDIGLACRATGININEVLTTEVALLNQGAIAEQFAGQELLAYQLPYEESTLYYWHRNKRGSQAEIDYIININNKIIPIEVKAGATGRLKSLKLFMNEKNRALGMRISTGPLSLSDGILSIPLYLISEIPRLITPHI